VYDGSQWIDAGSGGGGGAGSFVRWIYTAVGGETSLSGVSAGVPLQYQPGLEEVFINGALITRGIDYNASSGSNITGLQPLTAGDVVTVTSVIPLSIVQLPGQVTLLRWSTLATAGQTVLSGSDSTSQQLVYTAGLEEVYVNGAFLRRGVDYTATNGSTITILAPLTLNDEITVLAWAPFLVGSQIVNANVDSNAGITYGKLNLVGNIVNADVSASAGITTNKLSFTQSSIGAIARTVDSKLKDTVSRNDFSADANFTTVGTSPSARLNQIDFYQAGSSGHQIVPSDRGLVHKATEANTLSSWNSAPNGTPTGTNTAFSVLRAWGQDIITSPTGTRQCLELDTHYDIDSLLRGRFCTRSEGSPAVPHFDVYQQYNGTNCAYFGTKRDGTTGAVNLGFNARGFVFDTTATVLWAATSVITLGTKRLITRSQHLYLECTTAGTTGSVEPTPGQAGTTVFDGSVTWTVRSKLGSTPPAVWLDQNGNIGFNTISPVYGVHIAGADIYCEQGVRFPSNKISNIIKTSANITFGTINAGTRAIYDFTVIGATTDQTIALGIPWQLDQDGIAFQAMVRSTDLIRIAAHNYSGSSKTLAAQTFNVTLISTAV
jgi:hypothetical protein